MEPWQTAPLPPPSFSKTYEIDYFKLDKDLWRSTARVKDPIYNVVVSYDVTFPDFVIRDSTARFLSYPHKHCQKAAAKVKELVGAQMLVQFPEIPRRAFLGPQGCDTLFNLINLSGRGLVFGALAHSAATGAITTAQFRNFYADGIVRCTAAASESVYRESFSPKDCVAVPYEGDADEQLEIGGEDEPVMWRRLNVDYFELSDSLWRARAHLTDYDHNFIVAFDVSTADLVVQDANVAFLRQPYLECDWVQERIMKRIVGACLATDFRSRLARDFIGTLDGCGNVFALMNSMFRGFLQHYLSRNTVKGRLTPEQDALCRAGLVQDCLASGA
ncbi:MAG: DUF2889 domain-containing protein [Chloroflexi bacterium]|nr:DUF2889 domain-containing protein [Chloroflexota bacterium]